MAVTGGIYYARSRRMGVFVIGGIVSYIGVVWMFVDPLVLRFDPERSAIRTGLVSPVIPAVLLHMTLGSPFGEAERAYPRIRKFRTAHAITVLGLLGVASFGHWVTYGSMLGLSQFVRNSAWLTGLVLVTAVLISSSMSWLPAVVVVIATYAFGMNYSLGVPRPWAVLLQDASWQGLLSGVAVLALGIIGLVVAGPRLTNTATGQE